MRFLLIDRLMELETGSRAQAIKNVTLSEDFFAHHFPEQPLMPGTLLLECLVQLADLVIREASDFEHLGLLAEVKRLRLRKTVTPGDQVILDVQRRGHEGQAGSEEWLFEGQARVGTSTCASAEFRMERHLLEQFEDSVEARRQFRLLKPRNVGPT